MIIVIWNNGDDPPRYTRATAVRNLLTKNHTIALTVDADPISPVVLNPSVREPYLSWNSSLSNSCAFLRSNKYPASGAKTTTRVEKKVRTKSKMSLSVSKRGSYQLNIIPRQRSE
jgi:hypothetical protein